MFVIFGVKILAKPCDFRYAKAILQKEKVYDTC